MKGRRVWALVLLPFAFSAGFMAWQTWTVHDESKWMFSVFAVFFLILATVPFWPRRSAATETRMPPETRFSSHRLLLLAMLAFALIVLALAWRLLRPLFS